MATNAKRRKRARELERERLQERRDAYRVANALASDNAETIPRFQWASVQTWSREQMQQEIHRINTRLIAKRRR